MDIRNQRNKDDATISMLNADVQAIHADALRWRFKQPAPDTLTPKDAEALLATAGLVAFLALADSEPAGITQCHWRSTAGHR